MAIKIISSSTLPPQDSVDLKFDNGDFKVLNIIKNKWKFKNEESLLRFALAIMLKAENHTVSVRDESGHEINLKPTEDLLIKKE